MTPKAPEPLSRRDLICAACAVIVTGCGPRPAIPNDSGLPPVSPPDPSDTSDTSADSEFIPGYPCGETAGTAEEGWTQIRLADYPQLAEVNGSAVIDFSGRSLNVAQVFDGCWVAMERACTHEGVLVNYRANRNEFVCPRHGAIYAWNGEKIAGPQPRGLQVYPVAERDGDLWVKLP